MGVLSVYMPPINKDSLEEALGLLGEILEIRSRQPSHYVVCGGSSLLALGLVTRPTTKDVDILAQLDSNGHLVQPRPLPDWIVSDAEEVGEQLNLPADWFNTGPADDSFFNFGFPDGMADRLTATDFGSALRISFISRYDQIHFKFYAAADQDVGRHFKDLEELAPTREELLAAARWTRIHDPSEGFKFVMGELLKHLGHGDLIDQV